jgi:segregation and condensation protein A
MRTAELQLDLDTFSGPFDLLLTLVLREEISLMDVDLGEVVIAYVEHLEGKGELDLESATEFLVLIAALLELKSRLLLPQEEEHAELGPAEAADELLARMLEYRRYRDAASHLAAAFEHQRPHLYRSAPLPAPLRRVSLEAATVAYDPELLGEAIGGLLRTPPEPDVSHLRPTVSLDRRLRVLRKLLGKRRRISFDETFGKEDRLTQAVTLFALLEMYRRGEASWEQPEVLGPIEIVRTR